MGPIERELRWIASEWRGEDQVSITWPARVNNRTLDFAIEQASQMGLRAEFLLQRTADGEVISEAIEAAEALGL